MNELRQEYFEWMYDIVCGRNQGYRRLLYFLFETEFTYTIPLDGNRYEDGIDLRYRFAYEHDVDQRFVATELDIYPCSVLEMMVALAIRCEEHIMSNTELGDRTGKWFWHMIDSLGLNKMTDDDYEDDYVEYVIERFLNREYEPNGEGGLFRFNNIEKDVRQAQIWNQAMWYLNTEL